jgi:ferredoxin
MKIQVDMTRCQHYGQCVYEAPEFFRLNEQDELEYTADVNDDAIAEVEAAINICPMQAISIVAD